MYWIIIFSVIILIILLMKISIVIEFKNDSIDIRLLLYNFIKIKIKTFYLEKAVDVTKSKMPDSMKNKRAMLELFKDTLDSITYFMSKSHLFIDISLIYGIIGPDVTGILYGILNALIYSIDNILRHNFKKYTGIYNINPDFKNKKLLLTGKIILSIYFIPLMIFAFSQFATLNRYIKFFIKKEELKNVKSPNRRFDENYNG